MMRSSSLAMTCKVFATSFPTLCLLVLMMILPSVLLMNSRLLKSVLIRPSWLVRVSPPSWEWPSRPLTKPRLVPVELKRIAKKQRIFLSNKRLLYKTFVDNWRVLEMIVDVHKTPRMVKLLKLLYAKLPDYATSFKSARLVWTNLITLLRLPRLMLTSTRIWLKRDSVSCPTWLKLRPLLEVLLMSHAPRLRILRPRTMLWMPVASLCR
mmetsp:Transcript_27490/g.38637  ORF Transcript_27490/g.38637 Transcript_27490/m.38637 type:complete len:209 (-) Transcript_27490:276-902(-)